ncbi:GNAT family N-acetyltransferase [Candidatus Woesearchaeota archaeon]|nr:GNAT family N-acetyltransferase [Candidatus Woesearchaeota archaeon]
MENPEVTFGKAKLSNAGEINFLINSFTGKGVSPKPFSEVYSSIREYFIAKIGREIVGCIALHIVLDGYAELRSLAVKEKHQGKGIGTRLVEMAMQEAKEMGVQKLIAFTEKPGFFKKLKLEVVDRESIPENVMMLAHDIKCSRYPNCKTELISCSIENN